MEYYTRKNKQERMSTVIQSCTNALGNDELLALLAIRTYTAEKITEGLEKAKVAQERYERNLKEYGESYAASEAYTSEKDELIDEMVVFRGIAKVILRDDKKAQTALNLNGRMNRTHDKFPSQAEATLDNALNDESILARCSSFGFPSETLLALKDRIIKLPELRKIQLLENNQAQQSTIEWDESIAEMDEWYTDFIEIARYALISKPQLLELLGIVVSA